MRNDQFGRQILSETDICSAYLCDPNIVIKQALVDKQISFDDILEIQNKPNLIVYEPSDLTINSFDEILQNTWFIPEEYISFDIVKFVLDLCKTEVELQRVGKELILFQERNMFSLLRYCKYLVDTMRKHNIVWGVGRGSSVSSYVLYLIGIHRINSIYYDLEITEFLK
jgi:hypothetical protein